MSDKSPPNLGEFEQLVLLAVARLGEDAYGASVWGAIVEHCGRDVTLGAVYKTLMRLEGKGLLQSRMGEPTARRGGRRKRVYELNPAGREALERTLGALWRMARGLGFATGAS